MHASRRTMMVGAASVLAAPAAHAHDDAHAKRAVKCDMCKGIAGGPACVRACPTGAAIRVSPEGYLRVSQMADAET